MRRTIIIIVSLIILILVGYFLRIYILEGKMKHNTLSQPNFENYLTSPEQEILSPSGKYMLSLESYDDNGVMSFKVAVSSGERTLLSDEYFRTRDVFYALWDDNLDRVWAYSGDLGTYYWDICDGELVVYSYAENKAEHVPETLKALKPHLFEADEN